MCAFQAHASAQLGTRVPRELQRQAYNDALVARYQHLPDIRRIQRHRRLPAPLYKARRAPACACFGSFSRTRLLTLLHTQKRDMQIKACMIWDKSHVQWLSIVGVFRLGYLLCWRM
jgi:hypothetical protein